MSLPYLYKKILKLLEPERNNNKKRLSVLEHRVKEIEIYLHENIKLFPSTNHLQGNNPLEIDVIKAGRYCGHCNENLYSAKTCAYEDCPMGLHNTPNL